MEYVSEFIILIICSRLFPLLPSFRSKIIIRLLYSIVYLGFYAVGGFIKAKNCSRSYNGFWPLYQLARVRNVCAMGMTACKRKDTVSNEILRGIPERFIYSTKLQYDHARRLTVIIEYDRFS